MAARVARVARRFFGAELPGVVGAQEPVLIARPDQAEADTLEIAVVLGSRIEAAVLVDPDAAVLEIRGEVQLLVLGTERQEPAQLCARQIACVTRSLARRIARTPYGPPREKCSEESRLLNAYWPRAESSR